ncbi:MAG TPA: YceI family protein [Streptosporangiaceae bacterium]|nr:YceI family protein [Streptosporangiaceae bacterium]
MTASQAVNSPATQPAAIATPASGTYRIDAARSAITFTTRHLFGLGAVRGRFDLRDGEIRIAGPLDESSARARISAGSFRTGNPSRDSAVRSPRLLDVGAHPDITFISRRLDHAGGRWMLHGLLSVRGKAHPVELLIEAAQPAGQDLRLRASVRLDRYDFGITKSKGLAARHLGLRLDIVAHRL